MPGFPTLTGASGATLHEPRSPPGYEAVTDTEADEMEEHPRDLGYLGVLFPGSEDSVGVARAPRLRAQPTISDR
jgi:hypothetical protein